MLVTEQGKSLEIGCLAHGHPPPSHTWFRNSQVLPDRVWDSSYDLINNLVPSQVHILKNSLFIEKVSSVDSGMYRCVVNNSLGSEIVETQVIVRCK